ncbi:MAG: glutathione synthase [Proteobacteria bacterium]|nr:glutathione synthase [Pseudomonadota bacterium]
MIKMGMLMDPISKIHVYKDSSFAILLAAQERGWLNYYLEPDALWLKDGICWGRMAKIIVKDDTHDWFHLDDPIEQPLVDLDVFFMRKDPPFNMEYVHLTYLLEQAQRQGLQVINNPSSLRDANEKLFTAWFPQCCPHTLVTTQMALIKEFVYEEQTAVIKPLDGMGGRSVFKANANDPNLSVIIETLTENGKRLVMVQQFIEKITEGDKRILLINGEPVPYALARIPRNDDFRGNLAAGATGEGRELTERDLWICEQVGPTLKAKGLVLVGLDVIGDYLTEINVTSPTCIRELNHFFNLDIAGQLLDAICR